MVELRQRVEELALEQRGDRGALFRVGRQHQLFEREDLSRAQICHTVHARHAAAAQDFMNLITLSDQSRRESGSRLFLDGFGHEARGNERSDASVVYRTYREASRAFHRTLSGTNQQNLNNAHVDTLYASTYTKCARA